MALGALDPRLQCRTALKIQNGPQGAPKWTTGYWPLGQVSRFFDLSSPSIRKGRDREKVKRGGGRGMEGNKEITAEIMATNVVAT